MKATLAALAQYAVNGTDGLLSVSGICDCVEGIVPAQTENQLIPIPALFVALSIVGSIADGLSHTLELAVRHEDGDNIVQRQTMGEFRFALNGRGRPMRANLVVQLRGLGVPTPGDYEIVIFSGTQELCALPLYVDVRVAPDPHG